MNSNYDPPTYEESNKQYKTYSNNIKNETFTTTRGPDIVCAGKSIIIVDFVPWNDNCPCEDLGYLLLRANNWLQDNFLYDVVKCEMIPRMINSKNKLEISNCYIFNMTYGRRYFVNQLRLYIKLCKFKEVADQICLQTMIPDIIDERSHLKENSKFLIGLQCSTTIPKFENMSDLISKLNKTIQDGKINGNIINISSYYLNIMPYLSKWDKNLQDKVLHFEECDQGKCHLQCLRVFYKPGTAMDVNIGIKSFIHSEEGVYTLNDLTYSAFNWIKKNDAERVISTEIFSQYTMGKKIEKQDTLNDLVPTFVFFDKNLTLIKKETINVFYLLGPEYPLKKVVNDEKSTEIIWITPRKLKNIYETYYSFLCYLRYFLNYYDEYILDMESVYVLNSLSWSSIRHQTVERYYSQKATNYEIFTMKVQVIAGKVALPLKEAPLPCISSSKYSETCSII